MLVKADLYVTNSARVDLLVNFLKWGWTYNNLSNFRLVTFQSAHIQMLCVVCPFHRWQILSGSNIKYLWSQKLVCFTFPMILHFLWQILNLTLKLGPTLNSGVPVQVCLKPYKISQIKFIHPASQIMNRKFSNSPSWWTTSYMPYMISSYFYN